MYSFAESYRKSVDNSLSESLLNKDFQPARLYDPIKYILSNGGKRIRATLTLSACHIFSDTFTDAIPAATAIEVFHNFTLLHDDIMDNADIRRGNPTVHKKWNENIAILAGDAMMILANKFLAQSPARSIHDIFECFNTTALEVCEGQQLDMDLESTKLDNSSSTTGVYLNMIKLKTSVLLAASLKIGAIIGGASPKDQQLLYNAGISLGLGFQLQDDLLDSFGNEATFGKKIGGDILARKKTYLISKALEITTEKDRNTLIEIYNSGKELSSDDIQQVLQLFRSTGAKSNTEELIDAYFNRAFELLNEVTYANGNAFAELADIFRFIATRKV